MFHGYTEILNDFLVVVVGRDDVNTQRLNDEGVKNMILVIDNYDSFVYNLVQYLGELKEKPVVYRNNRLTLKEIRNMKPCSILISPGPGKPEDAGICIDVIKEFGFKVPIFGVCLGHQCITVAFGGQVVQAGRIMHGKTSIIHHNGKGVFKGVSNPFEATRYHSLIAKNDSLPSCLEVTAWTSNNEIMGLKHKKYNISGVQFHPESILTTEGRKILKNFIGVRS